MAVSFGSCSAERYSYMASCSVGNIAGEGI